MHKEMAVTVAQGDQNGVFNSVFFGFVHLLSLRFGAELASENEIYVLITQFVQTNY
jgi:hypothetical protein